MEMAPRRGLREDQQRDALPLASRRQEGEILESYVTKTRDKKAALAFMKKLLKRHGPVDAITTDGLRSYGAAMDELGNRDKQEIGR